MTDRQQLRGKDQQTRKSHGVSRDVAMARAAVQVLYEAGGAWGRTGNAMSRTRSIRSIPVLGFLQDIWADLVAEVGRRGSGSKWCESR